MYEELMCKELQSLKIYPVHIGSSYIYRVHELTKFINKSKIFIHVIFIIPYLCMKFQIQIPNNEGAVKKIKFLTDLESEICQKFLFWL
jgi:hypothetical protein